MRICLSATGDAATIDGTASTSLDCMWRTKSFQRLLPREEAAEWGRSVNKSLDGGSLREELRMSARDLLLHSHVKAVVL
jgi:hypothetical protein